MDAAETVAILRPSSRTKQEGHGRLTPAAGKDGAAGTCLKRFSDSDHGVLLFWVCYGGKSGPYRPWKLD